MTELGGDLRTFCSKYFDGLSRGRGLFGVIPPLEVFITDERAIYMTVIARGGVDARIIGRRRCNLTCIGKFHHHSVSSFCKQTQGHLPQSNIYGYTGSELGSERVVTNLDLFAAASGGETGGI